MIITDESKIGYSIADRLLRVPDEYLHDERIGYTVLTKSSDLGMKPIGRIYYDRFENLNYTSGEPVEKPIIVGGELGVIERYQKAGAQVYTKEQVINILNSRCYEHNDDLTPKLPLDVYNFLAELSDNEAKDKPKRAKELLGKYKKSDLPKEDE